MREEHKELQLQLMEILQNTSVLKYLIYMEVYYGCKKCVLMSQQKAIPYFWVIQFVSTHLHLVPFSRIAILNFTMKYQNVISVKSRNDILPSSRQSKWRHCKYSRSLIKPFRGVAQPSASTCTHCMSTWGSHTVTYSRSHTDQQLIICHSNEKDYRYMDLLVDR